MLRVRISELLAYITYFIVTVIIGFVEREENVAAASTLVVGIECQLPACYTRRNSNIIIIMLTTGLPNFVPSRFETM